LKKNAKNETRKRTSYLRRGHLSNFSSSCSQISLDCLTIRYSQKGLFLKKTVRLYKVRIYPTSYSKKREKTRSTPRIWLAGLIVSMVTSSSKRQEHDPFSGFIDVVEYSPITFSDAKAGEILKNGNITFQELEILALRAGIQGQSVEPFEDPPLLFLGRLGENLQKFLLGPFARETDAVHNVRHKRLELFFETACGYPSAL
jgi:hypothetical protein